MFSKQLNRNNSYISVNFIFGKDII